MITTQDSTYILGTLERMQIRDTRWFLKKRVRVIKLDAFRFKVIPHDAKTGKGNPLRFTPADTPAEAWKQIATISDELNTDNGDSQE